MNSISIYKKQNESGFQFENDREVVVREGREAFSVCVCVMIPRGYLTKDYSGGSIWNITVSPLSPADHTIIIFYLVVKMH